MNYNKHWLNLVNRKPVHLMANEEFNQLHQHLLDAIKTHHQLKLLHDQQQDTRTIVNNAAANKDPEAIALLKALAEQA